MIRHAVAALIGFQSLGSVANAGNTWDGGGSPNFDWGTTANWDNNATPGYGTVTFVGSAGTTNFISTNWNMNQVRWEGSSAWILNASPNTSTLNLFDFGGTQAKLEAYTSGGVTINAPVTFAANNGTPPNPFGEINAINSDITFNGGANGALTVNGSSVNGIKFWGGSGKAVRIANTVNASGKWLGITSTSGTNIRVQTGANLNVGSIYVMNGGTLDYAGGAITSTGIFLGGDGGATGNQDQSLGGTLSLSATTGGLTLSSPITAVSGNSSGALRIVSGNTSGTNTISNSVTLDTNLSASTSTGGRLAITGNLSGGGGLTKIGSGTLIVSGTNTNTGTSTVSSDVMQWAKRVSLYNATPASWTATNIVVNSGATAAFNVGGTGEFTASDLDTIKSLGTPTGGFKTGATLALDTTNAGGNFTYNSDIANPGGNTLSVAKFGSGTLTLNGNNSFTGLLSNHSGTLVISGNQSPSNLYLGMSGVADCAIYQTGGQNSVSGNVSLNATIASAFVQTHYFLSGGTLAVNGSIFVGDGVGTGNFSQSGGTVTTGGLEVGFASGVRGTYTLSAGSLITPSIRLSLYGRGTFNQSGGLVDTSTIKFTEIQGGGTYSLSGGRLIATTMIKGLGNFGANFDFNGGTLAAKTNTSTLFSNFSPTVNAGGGTIDSAGFSVTISQPVIHQPSLGASPDGGIAKDGAGTLILNAANTYTGGTKINGGVLQVGHADALGTTGSISFGGGALQHTAANAADYSGRFSTDAAQAYSIQTNGQNITWATALSSVGGSLTKAGTGRLTLSGANTYSGTTTVTGGTLRINSAHTGGGAYTIGDGATAATLDGIGSTDSAVTVKNAATLSPGNSIGDITVGALNLEAGANYAIEIDAFNTLTSDRTLVTSSSGVTLGNGVTFPVLKFSFTPAQVATFSPGKAFVVVQNNNASAGVTGQFAGASHGSTVIDGLVTYVVYYGAYTGSGNLVYGSNANGNDIVVEFSSVPEPSVSLGAVAILLFARRLRQT